MKNKLQEWIDIAEEDLSSAEWCVKGQKYLWSLVMCQQAIEKMLKAIYLKQKNEVPPKIHNLNKLLLDVGFSDELDEETNIFFDDLIIYYFSSRYPDKRALLKKECTEQLVNKYLNKTKEVFQWLKNKL